MQTIANETGREHKSVIINHGLRVEAKAEADAAAAALARYGIASEIRQVTAKGPTGGIQAFARTHRLSLLAAAGRASGTVVCFGHHMQDQAETVFMRLKKGSGLSGLSGIPAKRLHEGCLFVRPLLSVQPQLLAQICIDAGLTPAQDPSNHDRKFERVRVRQNLHQDKRLARHLIRLGNAARTISKQFDSKLAQHIDSHLVFCPPYSASIAFDCFLQMPDICYAGITTLTLQNIGKGEYPPEADTVYHLDASLLGGKKTTLAGCIIEPQENTINFIREARHLPEPLMLSDEKAGHIFDRCWHITGAAGLRFAPIGVAGYRQLAKGSALRSYLSQWPYPARLRFPILSPLDVEAGAHHFKDMEIWVDAPEHIADRFLDCGCRKVMGALFFDMPGYSALKTYYNLAKAKACGII